MDFEVENRENSIKTRFKEMSFCQSDFFLDLDSILEGLGEGLGGFGEIFSLKICGK